IIFFFFFQAEDGIRDRTVTGVQTCALPILIASESRREETGTPLLDTALWVFTALMALIALILGIDWLVRADTFPVRAVRFEGPRSEERRVGKECRAGGGRCSCKRRGRKRAE